MFKHRSPVSAHCDHCAWRGTYATRSEAFAAMRDHEWDTTHYNLLWRHTDGWRRFNPPAWLFGQRYVTDGGARV